MRRTGSLVVVALAVVLTCGPSARAALTDYQQAVLADNPLLYWSFDEPGNTDPTPSLVNNTADNIMTPQGGASRAASTSTVGGASLGRAASISGIGSMFFAPDLFGDPTPGFGNNDPGHDFIASQLWAVEFWINTNDATPNQYISEAYDAGGGSNNPGLIYNFNASLVEQFGGGGRWGTTMSGNQWHHVVTAFYGNSGGFADNLREIYVDGVLAQDTTSIFSAGHGLWQMSIGNATNGSNPINGLIDEYAIYELGGLPDLAARQAHVADIAQHRLIEPSPSVLSPYNQAVLASGPLKYWTFDEDADQAVEQVASLPADDLLPQGNATRAASTTTPGGIDLGNAAEFDGSDGTKFFATDLAGTQIGTKWAVEMWVRVDDPIKDTYLLESSQNNPGIIHGYAVGGAANNGLELFQGTRTGDTAPTTLADGEWHHVVIGNDTAGSHTIIIDDGTPLIFTGTGGPIGSQFLLDAMSVGGIAGGAVNGLDGGIDELALYDLSAAGDFDAALGAIADHFNVVPEPGTFGLFAWAALLLVGTRARRTSHR